MFVCCPRNPNGEIVWPTITPSRRQSGAPFVTLHGAGAETAQRLGVSEILLSLSHSEHYAVASAIGIGKAGEL